ncbi:MAG: SEC-C metal-binding domain-containing protein [Aliiglaciecola sp.]|uniref:SEC-C metal-binding domain-containing protein n=1 Tax=Aliiglaciecola sp. TaxID=1872441 RepID=UPI00329899E2
MNSPSSENQKVEDSCCSNTSCCPPAQGTIKREHPKVGRNDPCICGSEKKFKKCCGKNA